MRKSTKYIALILGITSIALIVIGGGFGPVKNTVINDGKPIIFAHRGVAAYHVENSLEAFTEAIKFGFNAIETDVRSTRDGKLIVFHDKSSHRLLNIDQDIINMDWHNIKRSYIQYEGIATRNKVLSLDQYLEQLDDSIISYLDMKEFTKTIADSLIVELDKHISRKKIIVADSDLLYLIYLKINNPDIMVCLEGFNKGKEWLYHIIPTKIKPNFYSSFIDQVDENHMQFLSENNLLDKKIVYGVNPKNISTAYNLGIHNIVLDFDSAKFSMEDIRGLLEINKRL